MPLVRRATGRQFRVTNKQRVASRGVEKIGLTDDQVASAEADFLRGRSGGGTARPNFPDWIYRARRIRPLLIVHLLQIRPEEGGEAPQRPALAWGISFPKTELAEKRVQYVVNATWLHENFPVELADLDKEEMVGDLE